MTAEATGGGGSLDGGSFAAWLDGMDAALRGERTADVPCGDCRACCASHQFVEIGPDETDTLAHVPAPLRFPAPRRPPGHVLLGYDEDGRCPMLTASGCGIYEHRPRACRTYDCRIFAATGVDVSGDKPEVAARAARTRFRVEGAADEEALAAVRAAARFLGEHPDLAGSAGPTVRAVLAVELRALCPDGVVDGEAVRVALDARRRPGPGPRMLPVP